MTRMPSCVGWVLGPSARAVAMEGRIAKAGVPARTDFIVRNNPKNSASLSLDDGVERLSDRHIPSIASQLGPHLTRHVRVGDTCRRIGESE